MEIFNEIVLMILSGFGALILLGINLIYKKLSVVDKLLIDVEVIKTKVELLKA